MKAHMAFRYHGNGMGATIPRGTFRNVRGMKNPAAVIITGPSLYLNVK
jgi:hypothetical protein